MSLTLLGLSGSLRAGSLNTALLRVAATLVAPPDTLTVRTVHGVPLYDGDVEAQGLPAEVVALREAIRAADGLLISTPEYNHGVPGVLKNALDWVSRGADQPLRGKSVAVLSASPGGMGGVRAQLAWLPTLACVGARVMHSPEFYLSNAAQAFTADGALADERTRGQLQKFVEGFAAACRTSR